MKKLKFIILIFILCNSYQLFSSGFNSLNDVKKYIDSKPEYPDIDNDNWLNPDYTSFYKQETKNFISRNLDNILIKLHIKYKPAWSVDDFYYLLKELTNKREIDGLNGDIIQKFTPSSDTKFIIFGDLQGALHSFYRDLKQLYNNGIIDKHFKLMKPNYYIIFLGNIIDHSPYILETLTLAMRIMQRNSESKVFYIKGTHENKQYWQNFNLKKELEIRAAYLSNEPIPLNKLVSRFFNTLPLALYLRVNKDKNEFVKIHYFDFENGSSLNDKYYSSFLTEKDNGVLKTLRLKGDEVSSGIKIKIVASISGLSRSTVYEETKGLAFDSEKLPTWYLLSSPTKTYRTLYQFFYDSFAILSTGKEIIDWKISLINRDVRTTEGFKTTVYNFISGKQVGNTKETKISKVIEPKDLLKEPEEKQNPIILGSSLDLSTGDKEVGKHIKYGISLALKIENNLGGINGRPMKVVFLDDKYDPGLTRKNYETFINKYKASLILCPMGGPTFEACLDLVKNNKVFVFFPYTGSFVTRDRKLKNVVNWQVSFADEMEILIKYINEKNRSKSYLIFYQEDSFGLTGLAGAEKIFKQLNITNYSKLPYIRNQTNFEAEVSKFKKTFSEAVGFITTAYVATEFIRQIGLESILDKKLFGVSDLGNPIAKKFFEDKGIHITVSNIVPNPINSKIEIAKECCEDYKKIDNVEPDVAVLLGYLCTRLTAYVLRKIEGDITHEKIRKVIEGIKNYDFKGLTLNFNPKNNQLNNKLWLDDDASREDKWTEFTIQ